MAKCVDDLSYSDEEREEYRNDLAYLRQRRVNVELLASMIVIPATELDMRTAFLRPPVLLYGRFNHRRL